jgi:hypothetical protein
VETLCSEEIGLDSGTIASLDSQLRRLPRQAVVARAVSLLNALSANRSNHFLEVNAAFAREMSARGVLLGNLVHSLRRPDATFVEPFQVLTFLRRAMAVSADTDQLDPNSTPGLQVIFDALRFAADVSRVNEDRRAEPKTVDRWLEVAAGLMPRLWFGEQPNVNLILARTRIMLRDAEAMIDLAPRVATLRERMKEAVGLTVEEIITLTLVISYWAGTRSVGNMFQRDLTFNPSTLLAKTTIPERNLRVFLERTSRNWDEILTDAEIGGPIGHLPFRDRPFIRFRNETVAVVMPELLAEKLSGDIFWWLKMPTVDQQQMWQADWGYVTEAYLVGLLNRIASGSGSNLIPRLQLKSGEIDGVMWHKGHVALFEITSARIGESVANAGDPVRLRSALKTAFVSRFRPGQEPYREVVLQLVRDITAVLSGQVNQLPLSPDRVQRIYPVVLAEDKRVKTPGVWPYLDAELRAALPPEHASRVSALAVLSIDDLEEVDEAIRERPRAVRGTPPGLLKLLSRWDIGRGAAPSWWQFMQGHYPQYRRNRILDHEAKQLRLEIEDLFWDKS